MFTLNQNDHDPLYVQLYKQIRADILSGKLPADSRLPSVRDLADELSTSRNTVENAYQELHAEGFIFTKPRSGYFVSNLDQEAAPSRLTQAPRPCAATPKAPPSYAYDFHPARLDSDSFPAAPWRKYYLDCLREDSRQMAQYGNSQGDWGLRCNIREYLERSRGVACLPEQIVVCSGLQHSLDIIAILLKETHLSVAVENPGYPLARSVFSNHSLAVLPIPVGPNGIDIESVISSGSDIAYVTPSHQLPMGCVMPVGNRLKLIEWADSGGKFIIEDDYDSELRYHGKPIPSLQGLRPHGNIIYTGTFSKILSPALRLSYMVLPTSLLAAYRRRFNDYHASVSLLEQRTLAGFMEGGHWDRHVRRMRVVYKRKHAALLQAVERHFGPRAVVVGQGAGLHVVLRLADGAPSEDEIVARAGEKGVRLLPFARTFEGGEAGPTRLILGFGGMTPERIEAGVALLSRICLG